MERYGKSRSGKKDIKMSTLILSGSSIYTLLSLDMNLYFTLTVFEYEV